MPGTARRRTWARAATVCVVAYGLVLQALLSAIVGSSGAAAAIWQGPGIICTDHGAASGSPESSGQAHHDVGCCILHGLGFDRGAAPPPTASVIIAPAATRSEPARPIFVAVPHRLHEVRPLGARAPPILV